MSDAFVELSHREALKITMGVLLPLRWRSDGWLGGRASGRRGPAYHPAALLKIYVYGYLNRMQSSRRLERECK